ncbi:MAG: 3-oxoacyl-[acyl-carrier protein] reductase, partial [Actinomycetota bacterium]
MTSSSNRPRHRRNRNQAGYSGRFRGLDTHPSPPPRRFEEFEVGQSATLERLVSAADVDDFAALTGDNNPLHVDDAYASEVGMGRRVVHGMLTAGFVSTVIGTMLPGPGALWLSEQFAFRAPVRIGDTIRAEVRIRRISPATRILLLEVAVTNQRGTVVLDGEATVQVLDTVMEMADPIDVRNVVVTGAGRGIGAA